MIPIAAYRAERDALLARLTQLLEQDDRVVAAWLFGSLGRGTADDLSDIDLIAVVADKHISPLVTRHRDYAARIDAPVLIVEAPQNAPEGGGYLMVYYDSPPGPLQVDWYWQPASTASIPADARVLFDRIGLPRHDGPTVFTARPGVGADTTRPMQFIGFFWAMLLITAKYAARAPHAERMDLLRYVLPGLNQARAHLGRPDPPLTLDELPEHAAPTAKLVLLRRLAGEMADLMPAIATRGEPVPAEVVPGVHRYLDLIEGVIGVGKAGA